MLRARFLESEVIFSTSLLQGFLWEPESLRFCEVSLHIQCDGNACRFRHRPLLARFSASKLLQTIAKAIAVREYPAVPYMQLDPARELVKKLDVFALHSSANYV